MPRTMSGWATFSSSKQRLMNTPREYSMVPIAPSATITRRDNCSRNSWARVLVLVFMGSRRNSRFGHGYCDVYNFSAGGRPPVLHSCLMQDETEPRPGFSRKMSLKGKIGMLGIDHRHGRFGSHQPGADPGLSGRPRRGAVCRAEARG